MIEVILPKVDMAMTEGLIASWLRREGDIVKAGEPLFEIETDKANVEVESPASGMLWGVRVQPGQTAAIAEVVAYILAPGEAPPELGGISQGSLANGHARDGAQRTAATQNDQQSPAQPSDSARLAFTARLRATPLARKISREHGVELALITGSGPKGRIGRQDVLKFLSAQGLHAKVQEPETRREEQAVKVNGESAVLDLPEPAVDTKPSVDTLRDVTRVPLTNLRKIIAERMTASVRNAPHFTLTMTVDMTQVVALRQRVSAAIEKQVGAKPSFTVILARALAPLLLQHQSLNAAWDTDAVLLHHAVHLGVALDREGDLLVPVIRDAHRKSLAEITGAWKDIGERAKNRKLAPEELRGSTFTISNLGMFGVDSFTAILNTPECGILAVGRIVDTPVAHNGALVIRPTMQITLSADHRIVDGATAARFLADLRGRLEEPYLLL